ncbi:shikimate dehydrogenase [Clostridium swellfunianum]|uniref:shikimate dehydrogenase n=1 Tax=Clostridium swellfunianum TaxID=1367462 RepID=UPI00202FDA20|nr:shikimate dehydrogenase [Clostridium swellfunianum]MCM0648757.1 shikimate dehydrogenase [Clostridium swellfunianum]
MYRCGLLGKNINYSSSPEIHNNYYLNKKVPISYELFDLSEECIEHFINNLKKNNIIGFNVTIPYKQTIIKYLSQLEYPADEIGAVNTVVVEEDKLVGYNTDYYGFISSIKDYNIVLNKRNAIILGAGGAAKSVSCALNDLGCSTIEIAARNAEKAINDFNRRYKVVSINDYLDLSKYDIIVNCTPVGNINSINQIPINFDEINKSSIFYDLIYRPDKTRFLSKAEQLGAFIINGKMMLLHQAYKAADIWISSLQLK